MGKYPEYVQLNVRILREQHDKLMQVAIGLGAVKGESRGESNPNKRVLFAEHVIPLFLAVMGDGDVGALAKALCNNLDAEDLGLIFDLIDAELTGRGLHLGSLSEMTVGG